MSTPIVDESAEDRRRQGKGLALSTKFQVSAHMFFARRAVAALTRRRVSMQAEPGRRQSMAVLASVMITVVGCLGALFWSVLRPAGSARESRILADQQSGALYVRVGERLYPALNLASARLIAGQPDSPVRVRRSEIDSRPRGPLVGIAGAPNEMSATSPPRSSWLVCDQVTKAFGAHAPEPVAVTVIDGQPDLGQRRQVLGDHDALVRKYGDDVWLIHGGRRSLVDRNARPALLALGLSPDVVSSARPMSRALFDAIPVGPELTVPTVPQAGSPAGFAEAPGPVGTVVSTPQVGGQVTYSVVLSAGMQTVTAVAAQILANAGPTGTKMPVLAGAALAKLPTADGLDMAVYPDTPPHILDSQVYSAACWHWAKVSGESLAATEVIAGPTIPVADSQTDKVVELVADKSGWQADQVYFGSQSANYLIATGDAPSSPVAHPLWWVSESGVRFGVERNEETLRALGLSTTASPAPWSILRLLAPGPALSRADALTRHNTLPTDNHPGELETPK